MVHYVYLKRYGDAINPWGDLITMAKTWCIVKTDGLALLGLPSQFNKATGIGSIGFNAGRLYGNVQLSHLFANWKQGNKPFRIMQLYVCKRYIQSVY